MAKYASNWLHKGDTMPGDSEHSEIRGDSRRFSRHSASFAPIEFSGLIGNRGVDLQGLGNTPAGETQRACAGISGVFSCTVRCGGGGGVGGVLPAAVLLQLSLRCCSACLRIGWTNPLHQHRSDVARTFCGPPISGSHQNGGWEHCGYKTEALARPAWVLDPASPSASTGAGSPAAAAGSSPAAPPP